MSPRRSINDKQNTKIPNYLGWAMDNGHSIIILQKLNKCLAMVVQINTNYLQNIGVEENFILCFYSVWGQRQV